MKASDATLLLKLFKGEAPLSNEDVFALLKQPDVRGAYEERKEIFAKYGMAFEDFTRLLCLIMYLRRPSGGLSNR